MQPEPSAGAAPEPTGHVPIQPPPRRQIPWRELPGRFPVTLGLTAITFFFFFLESLLGGTTNVVAHLRLGSVRGDLVFEHGQVFRLMCPVFLHHGPIHLGLNWFAFLQLCGVLEHFYGSWRALLIYLLCGLTGCLFSAAFLDSGELRPASVGASGAILGQAGFLLGAGWYGADPLRAELRRLLRLGCLRCSVLLTFGLGGVLWLALPTQNAVIDNWGHLGGFLGGMVLGGVFRHGRLPVSSLTRALTVGMVGFTLACFVGMAVAGGRPESVHRQIAQFHQAMDMFAQVQTYREEGRDAEGLVEFRQALSKLDQPEVLNEVGGLLTRTKDDVEASLVLERCLKLAPDDPDALNGLAWHLLTRLNRSRRDPQRALRLADRSLSQIPPERVLLRSVVLDTRAEALHQLKRHQEAVTTQRQAVKHMEAVAARRSGLERLRHFVKATLWGMDHLPGMRRRLKRFEEAAQGAVAPVGSR